MKSPNDTKLVDKVTPESMDGDTELEKWLNAYLTKQFIFSYGVPADECLSEAKEIINKLIEKSKIEELVKIQCSDGNWDYDPYMHGMANGLICALSILKNEEPKYLEAPFAWIKDRK